jgi:hypothetical protein
VQHSLRSLFYRYSTGALAALRTPLPAARSRPGFDTRLKVSQP